MNLSFNNILRQYFNTASLEDTGVEDIERMAGEYPYHTLLQLLLAKKYRQLRHAGFNAQAAKTALYFNNPYWLNLLLQDEPEHATASTSSAEQAHETVQATDVAAAFPAATTTEHLSTEQSAADTRSAAEELIATLQENLRNAANDATAAKQDTTNIETGTAALLQEVSEEKIAEELPVTTAENDAAQTAAAPEQYHTEDHIDPLPPTAVIAQTATAEPVVAEPLPETQDTAATDQALPTAYPNNTADQQNAIPSTTPPIATAEESATAEVLPEAQVTPAVAPAGTPQEQTPLHGEPAQVADEAEPDADEAEIDATPEAPAYTTGSLEGRTKLSDIWKQPADLSQSQNIIPVEPLYTIDYFASQGIKLSQTENAGQDKLSLKLKSFTEWLKTMKRIHPEKLESSPEQIQTVIQHIAENSNKQEEVLTESIAEVFARQGLMQKAINVYEKLSLQNPDKSAYFAAKISKLNES